MTQTPGPQTPRPLLQDIDQGRHDVDINQSKEALGAEIRRLRGIVDSLTRQLSAATLGKIEDREARRAALNLMEDAVEARESEKRENNIRRQAEAELRFANRRKDEFLATLAHELRAPLAPIRNCLQMLKTDRDDPSSHQLYEIVDHQIAHLVRLVDDLMEVARITSGKIELRKERTNIVAFVQSVLETLRSSIESTGQTLHFTPESEPLFLEADPVRLTQIVTNLINNAAKYTDSGGSICVDLRRDGQSAVLSVRDTGVGIPADMLEQIFDLFKQVGHTYSRAHGGLGIGLTLTKKLVELHGGTILAQSPGVGQGSTFIVNLPLATGTEADVARIPAPSSTERERPLSQRILVVDDSRDSALSMGMLLKSAGAEVQVVYDGESALAAVQSFQPEAVLLDIGMPRMDGFEVAGRIRALPNSQNITLIALTGWGQAEDRQRSKEAGFDHHLVKPIEFDVLLNFLRSNRGTSQH